MFTSSLSFLSRQPCILFVTSVLTWFAADHAVGAQDDKQPTPDATQEEEAQHHQELAKLVATYSRFDDFLFVAMATHEVGAAQAPRDSRSAALQKAFLQLQPQLQSVCADSFAHMSDEQLRMWMLVLANDRQGHFVDSLGVLNEQINRLAGERGKSWLAIIHQAAIQAAHPSGNGSAPSVPQPSKPGF